MDSPASSLPELTSEGILPPLLGDATNGQGLSPYAARMTDLVARFGTTPKRRKLLRGLLKFRNLLRASGFMGTVQWIDGSFVEGRSEEPRDIDLVTVAWIAPKPRELDDQTRQLLQHASSHFGCDGPVIHLNAEVPMDEVERAAHFLGFFSHRRDRTWKGIVAVGLDDATQDTEALSMIDRLDAQAEKGR